MQILRGKKNRVEIMQEISYSLLKNYTRTLLTIEDGPEHIELSVYKMANLHRTWRLQVDKNPLWARNLDKSIPDMDLYSYREEPDLFAECLVIFLDNGILQRDIDIFFKYWREEHSKIFIAFKMELPLSYVIRSLRGTLKLLRKHLNPTWTNTSKQGQWKTDKKRTPPKYDPKSIEKMKATKALLPRRQCPKCKRELLFGMFDTYGHGPNCQKTPLDPNRVVNPNRSKAYSGVPKTTGTCKHCGVTMSKSNLARYHNDNCKLKPKP
jgi:hypothetical protein